MTTQRTPIIGDETREDMELTLRGVLTELSQGRLSVEAAESGLLHLISSVDNGAQDEIKHWAKRDPLSFTSIRPVGANGASEEEFNCDAACAAIAFALDNDEGLEFLRFWNEGEFDVIRKEWPEAPEEVFIGADPLHVRTN